MQEILANLLALQEAEQGLLRLEQMLHSLPAERATRQAQLEQARARWQERLSAYKEGRVEAERIELEIQSREAEIRKLEGRLNVARSNSEFTAIQHQIRSYKGEISASEDRALGLMERGESLAKAAAEAEAVFREEERAMGEFLIKMEEEEARIHEETERLRQQRAALLVQADSEAYLQYVQLMGFFSSRGGVVLSPAIRGVCKACGSRILPNDEVKLHQNHQLVRCKSCGRILYLPKT